MKRKTVGVTFSDGWLRAVEIADDVPIRFGELALEPGVVEQGVIADEGVFAAALKELWQTAGFSGKRVAVGIEAEAAMLRRITLPPLAPNEIAEAVMYDIANVLGYPTDEAVIDHAVIESVALDPSAVDSEARQTDVETDALVVAVRAEVIEGLRRCVLRAGLRWSRAELGPAAGVALLNDLDLSAGSLGAVVAVGEQTTSISVHDEHGLLFARVVTAGVGATASLSHELESQLAELENLRAGKVNDSSADPTAEAEAPGVGVVVEGVRRTLHYYSSDIDRRPFSSLVLCGPRSRANGLVERLTESLPGPIDIRPLDRAGWPTTDSPERFDVAFGIARLVVEPTTPNRRLSLVPRAVVERRRDRRVLAAGAMVALVVAGLAAVDAGRRSDDNAERLDTVTAAEQQLGRLRGQAATTADVRTVSAEVERRREQLARLVVGDVDVAAVFGQIAEAMPADTSITAMRVTRTEPGLEMAVGSQGREDGLAVVSIDGTAPDLDGVGRWVDSVASLGLVEDLWLRQVVSGPYAADSQIVALFSVDATIGTAGAAARSITLGPLSEERS